MNQLRILHTESSCGWGGQEIRILTEASGMIERGHQVTILACPQSTIYREAIQRKIPAVALSIEKKRLRAWLALRRWLSLNRDQFDVINTHSSTDAWLVAIANLTFRKPLKMLRTRHVSTQVHNNFSSRWLYLRATEHIITTGEKLRQTLHEVNGFPLEKMTSVPTGIDLNYFIPKEKHAARTTLKIPQRSTIGILATLRSWKGHIYLVEAWEKLQLDFPEWQLLIVGDGPQRNNLEQRVNGKNWQKQVIFAGNQQDTATWLNAMDIFVLPSYANEGVPQTIMQAMACGIPVISTPIGAIPEIVQDGKTGILVPPQDTTALIYALKKLMPNYAAQQQFAKIGLEYAHTYFDQHFMLEKMERIFQLRNQCD